MRVGRWGVAVLFGLGCSPQSGPQVSGYGTAVLFVPHGAQSLTLSPPRSVLITSSNAFAAAFYVEASDSVDSDPVSQLPLPDQLFLGAQREDEPAAVARTFGLSQYVCAGSEAPFPGVEGAEKHGNWGGELVFVAAPDRLCTISGTTSACLSPHIRIGSLISSAGSGKLLSVEPNPGHEVLFSSSPGLGREILWDIATDLAADFLAGDAFQDRRILLSSMGLQDYSDLGSETAPLLANSAPFLAAHIDGIVATPEEILGGVIGIDRTRPEVLYLSDGQWHRAGGRLVQRITAGRYIAGVGAILAADVKDDDGTEYAVLLKYDPIQADGPEPWRWFAILRDYHDVRALAPMAGGVAFGGVGGWGHFSRKTGLCVGDQALTKVGTLIPTGPASVFMAGEDNSGAVLYRRAAF